MIKLYKNANVYAPEALGINDVLVIGDKIAQIDKCIDWNTPELHVETIACDGKLMFPGFIDGHVHLLGGGGEGGYKTRTPELFLSDLIKGGITTVVGCLGTDGVTRSVESLVAKAYGLREEGVSAYVYTGSYRLPLVTVTGSIQKDIMMIDPVIGIGEIAISDHRSASPTVHDLAVAASDARVGGILSGKAGLVNIHLGDGKDMLSYLFQMQTMTELPYTQFLPTHANRNKELYEEAIQYALDGGYIDFTTSTVQKFIDEGEVRAGEAFKIGLDKGVSPSHMTFSSDGQGSLPAFDASGNLEGLAVGRVTSLYDAVKKMIGDYDMPIEIALKPITSNPAKLLKLKDKGVIKVGADADLVLVDEQTLNLSDVYAKGRAMMVDSILKCKGTFE